MSDDEDTSDDSDYAPEIENEDDDDNIEVATGLTDLSHSRKRKANEIFEDMKKNYSSQITTVMNKAVRSNQGEKSVKKSKRIKEFLSTVFGSKRSTEHFIVSSNEAVMNDKNSATVKESAKASVEKLYKKQKIVETRKYGGQSITIERSVKEGSISEKMANSNAVPETSALDKVLNDLKGPKVVSTVAKSAYDWDNFKEKEGLEDELSVAAKEGYLTRKDFLQRCDVREYEKERDSRVKND